MNPPTVNELVGPPPHGLDEWCTLKNSLGKTQNEARALCKKTSAVTEDFTYMAAAGLCYYLPAALSYLESEDSEGDWDFAHGLLCALSIQVAIFGMKGEPLELIKQIADYCDTHRTKFAFRPKFAFEADDLLEDYLEKIRRA